MVVKRIKIRYHAGGKDATNSNTSTNDSIAKVLRFDENIAFGDLIKRIAVKLGLSTTKNHQGDDDEDIHQEQQQQQFELWLGGESLLEATDEIDSGDEVVVIVKEKKQTTIKNESSSSSSSSTTTARESENDHDDSGSDSDDSKVEDVTEQCQKQRQPKRKIVDLLSSGEDDDDDDEEEEEEEGEDDDNGSVVEGSDAWNEASSSSYQDQDDSDDSDFDEEEEEDRKLSASRKRKANNKPPRESPLQVLMDEKDVPAAPGKRDDDHERVDASPACDDDYDLEEVSTLVDGAGRKRADRAVKDRIIKLLNTGFHDQSNENEAKNAMKLAQRLMHKHNLSQALLLKERQESSNKDSGVGGKDEILKGGTVTVRIVQRKTGQPALLARWLSQLTHPITDNFEVKCYHTTARGKTCSVTFYGIYTNAQLAAYAYRVATERIAQMAASYTPEKRQSSYCWNTSSSSSSISTKSARLSYAMGVVEGISKDVAKNIKLEKERRLRKLERARVAVSTGEAYEESEDDDDDDDKEGTGFSFPNNPTNENEQDKKPAAARVSTGKGEEEEDTDAITNEADDTFTQQNRKPKAQADSDRRLQELEKEQQAAIVLVDHREKIADQVLEEQGIKLSKGRKGKAISFDHRSYCQGIEDAKEIDLNQRAIRDEVKVKKEKKRSR
jgi:Protein of unknown function (DUF2786)